MALITGEVSTMSTPDAPETNGYASLYRPGKVHSSVYTSSDIFEAEIDQIFYRTWVYIGHESEVPNVGDFQTRQLGRQPVILVRGKSGGVNVLFNRCRHRGAVVAEAECGYTKFFKCWWHGYVYDTDGALAEVPRKDAYPDDYIETLGGLSRPARVDNYRGFVFASMRSTGQSLTEYLGRAAAMIDYLVDASPEGKIRVGPGVTKTKYDGNWKLLGMDGYHADTVHASVFAVWRAKPNSGLGATHRGDVMSDKSPTVTRGLGNGHSMLDYRRQRLGHLEDYLDHLRSVEGGAEYIEAMWKKHGKERGDELLAVAGDAHVAIYPNFHIANNHVRIISPVSANETKLFMYPVTLLGVSDQLNEARLRTHESFYGSASAGSPDDAEIFERVQRGMQTKADPWLDLSRGMHREKVDSDGSIVGAISDEVPQREQMREWVRLMTAE